MELSAKVLRNNLEILDRFAPEDLEFMDQQEVLLKHFKYRYGHIEDCISRLGLRRGLPGDCVGVRAVMSGCWGKGNAA